MANFFKKNAKMLLIGYAIALFATLIAGLFYMTNLANVHVYYSVDEKTGEISFNADDQITSTGMNNTDLFYYFGIRNLDVPDNIGFKVDSNGYILKTTKKGIDYLENADGEEVDFADNPNLYFAKSGYAKIVYDFQIAMSNYNTQIIIYCVICLICFAAMMIFSNHSRKIYYKSNLIIGVAMPLVVTIYTFIMMIVNFGLLGTFNQNFDLFRVVSVMQSSKIDSADKNSMAKSYQSILNNSQNFGSSCYFIQTIFYVLVIVYSLFLIIYTIYRYKECAKRRNEIIERAVQNND